MSEFINLESIAERLMQIQSESGFNAKDFCEETDIKPSTFSQIKSGSGKVSVDIINKVVQRWGTRFSPQWFLFGELDGSIGTQSYDGDSTNTPSNDDERLLRSIEEVGRLKTLLEQQRPREIERITVFYTDKSVAHYVLER